MDLNLYIIKEDIPLDLQDAHLTGAPWQRALRYPALCTDVVVRPDPHILYILSPRQLPVTVSKTPFSFIVIGRPASCWYESPCDFLVLDEQEKRETVLNTVNQLYYQYAQWESSLQEIIDQKLPAVEFGKRSRDIVRNGIYAQAAGYRLIFAYAPRIQDESVDYKEYRIGYETLNKLEYEGMPIDADLISDLISDREYNDAMNASEPTIFSGSQFGFRSLFYNIQINGTYVARVMYDEVLNPFTGKDFATVKVLGDYLAKALAQGRYYQFDRPVLLDYVMDSLISHKLLPAETIEELLADLQWNMNDSFVCVVLRLISNNNVQSALDPIALDMSRILQSECYTIHHKSIVFVFNLTRLGIDSRKLLSKILPTLRDNLLTASVSSTFHDFKKLYYHYTQAVIAEEIGHKRNPTDWYFHFSDYHLHYLIHKCINKTPPESLIPEGLYALMEHDKNKGTNYTQLLKSYLMNERNIASTIRETYIHRNTFLYRIRRIEEILDRDLDDPEVRITLLIAYYIMEAVGNGED